MRMFMVETSYIAAKTYFVMAESKDEAENKVINNPDMNSVPHNGAWEIDQTVELLSAPPASEYDTKIK